MLLSSNVGLFFFSCSHSFYLVEIRMIIGRVLCWVCEILWFFSFYIKGIQDHLSDFNALPFYCDPNSLCVNAFPILTQSKKFIVTLLSWLIYNTTTTLRQVYFFMKTKKIYLKGWLLEPGFLGPIRIWL